MNGEEILRNLGLAIGDTVEMLVTCGPLEEGTVVKITECSLDGGGTYFIKLIDEQGCGWWIVLGDGTPKRIRLIDPKQRVCRWVDQVREAAGDSVRADTI